MWSALSAAAIIGVGLLLLACNGEQVTNITNPNNVSIFPPTAATEQASDTSFLYGLTLVIAVIVFAIVEGLLIIITLRFRRKPTDTELPFQRHGSSRLEILWTLIPAITVMALFSAALVTLNKQEALSPNPDVVVNVTGFQWQWTFDYPNQGNISFTGSGRNGPEMVVPTNETIRIRLQSKDVIHSFYVPLFNYKLDVIPGRINEFDIKLDQPGSFGGQCAEFCGLGHADMFFSVRAVAKADFDAWVAQAQQAASATPAPAPSGAQSVTLNAVNPTTFDPKTLTAKAGAPITIDFKNVDTSAPHNVAIQKAVNGQDWLPNDPSGKVVIVNAGQTATFNVPALPAGTYTYYCTVHGTAMTGTLTVTP